MDQIIVEASPGNPGAKTRPGVSASPAGSRCPLWRQGRIAGAAGEYQAGVRDSALGLGPQHIFKVKTEDGEQSAIVKDWQVDPVKGALLHVDLLRIAMDVRMRVKVPVQTFGEPQGVKLQGGVFEMVTREVEIECLPGDIPTEFKHGYFRLDDGHAACAPRTCRSIRKR